MRKPLVFISHITTEKEIAIALKWLVEQAFLGMVEVFVSSDPNSIAMGGRWLDDITYGLKKCVIEIVLASPVSVTRPWINFEAGAGWVRDISVIPLCHSGMTPSMLPAPLSSLQAGVATDATHLERVFAVIATALECKPPEVGYEAFVEKVKAFEKVSEQIQELAEKSPVADEGGLSSHEIATLVAIAEQSEAPTSSVWPATVTRAMNEAGYRNIAATLGMAGLQRKGLVEALEVDEYNNSGTAIKITHNGWSWLESNVERLELKLPSSPPYEPDSTTDIPF